MVRIGCCPIPLQRLQSFLGALHVRGQPLQTEVLHLPTAEQLARLRRGEIDLGVIDYAAPEPPLEVQPLYAGERGAVVMPVAHRLALRPAVLPGDLQTEILLCPPRATNPAFHDALTATLAAAGHRVAGRHELGGADPRDVLLAVAEGRGIAVAGQSALQHVGHLATLLTERLLEPPVHLPQTMLAWAAAPSALHGAIAAARAVASELYAHSARA